jgi:type VI protein secretion system component Hcp
VDDAAQQAARRASWPNAEARMEHGVTILRVGGVRDWCIVNEGVSSMNRSRLVSLAVLCVGLMTGATAMAASDYYIKLGGVEGESTGRAQTSSGEVMSWSWGTSNASSAASGSGAGAGKVSMSDLSATAPAPAPRDAASGMATGKRQHKPVAMDSGGTTGTATGATAAPSGEVRSVSVVVAEPGNAMSQQLDRACASGKHFDKVELSLRGQVTEMHDVVVSSCSVAGKERKYEFRGHVTLLK